MACAASSWILKRHLHRSATVGASTCRSAKYPGCLAREPQLGRPPTERTVALAGRAVFGLPCPQGARLSSGQLETAFTASHHSASNRLTIPTVR